MLNKKIIAFVAIITGSALIIAAVYAVGFGMGYAQSKNIVISGIANGETPASDKVDFKTFWQAWDELKKKQIHGDKITPTKMAQGAMKGLAGAFDDPYTVYFNPEDSRAFIEQVDGNFGGIGAEIGVDKNQLIVVAPLKDSPAEHAGLRPKDRIIEINGKSTRDMTIDEAVKIIRGDIGTKAILTIFREGWDKTKKIEIVRQNIEIPTIDSKLDADGILHVGIYQFNSNVNKLFADAINNGLRNGAKGLALDLRNDPGGYLAVAVDMAGWFMDGETLVVRQRAVSGDETLFRAHGNALLKNFPTVVLINEGSASASEILAGALRDDRGIKLVGEKSFGKGTVQELDPLQDGSTLKITIANWLLPSGLLIDKNGLVPDYTVPFDEERFAKDGFDSQLNKAIEILKSQIGAKR